jgi:FG-GAP repeat
MLGPTSSLQLGTEPSGANRVALLARHRSRGWHRRGSALVFAVIFAALSLALAASASAATFAQQATLTASDEIGKSLLGSAVALAHDGDIALVGGPQDNNGIGAAWVFTRKHGKWSEQAKLTGAGEIGGGMFGTSVALSSDGKTALIGAPGDNGGFGAAWVVTRKGSTWTQRGSKLVGTDARGGQEESHCETDDNPRFPETYCFVGHPAGFGASVSLSSDGRTVLVGGPGDNKGNGAVWVFTRSGATWTQQGEKLTGGGEQNFDQWSTPNHFGGQFGASVSLSANGNTALIGGPRDRTEDKEGGDRPCGAAWTFIRSRSKWTQQGEKLSRCPEYFSDFGMRFGESVALSSDSSTALIGAPDASYIPSLPGGVVWAFTPFGSTWTQQGEPLVNRAEKLIEYSAFGVKLASSANGNVVLIAQHGGETPPTEPANAWVFSRSGSVWSQQFPPLTCAEEGCDVALSGDASTALVGTAVYVNSTQDVEEEHK